MTLFKRKKDSSSTDVEKKPNASEIPLKESKKEEFKEGSTPSMIVNKPEVKKAEISDAPEKLNLDTIFSTEKNKGNSHRAVAVVVSKQSSHSGDVKFSPENISSFEGIVNGQGWKKSALLFDFVKNTFSSDAEIHYAQGNQREIYFMVGETRIPKEGIFKIRGPYS